MATRPGLSTFLLSTSQRLCDALLPSLAATPRFQMSATSNVPDLITQQNLSLQGKPFNLALGSKRSAEDCETSIPRKRLRTDVEDGPTLSSTQGNLRDVLSLPRILSGGDEYTHEQTLAAVIENTNYLAEVVKQMDGVVPPSRIVGWTDELDRLKRRCRHETIIAVLGTTGAGKSSLINAVLDQELFPTSCICSCTAAVIETSYHCKETIEAEIVMLTRAEWQEDLRHSRSDLGEDECNLLHREETEEMCAAKAKLSAVYPGYSVEMLKQIPFDELLDAPAVRGVLGTVKHISCQTAAEFTSQIAEYVESKDDFDVQLGLSSSAPIDAVPQLWPLVKRIRCRVKAEVLSTGARLVDLPGTQDVNLARASIAKSSIKKADAFWIVAPINRAVSDKIAQDLLGEAFKRQLLMDCSYDHTKITFICTKTDQISSDEAMRILPSLKHNERARRLSSMLADLEKQTAKLQNKVVQSQAEEKRLKDELTAAQDHLSALKAENRAMLSAPPDVHGEHSDDALTVTEGADTTDERVNAALLQCASLKKVMQSHVYEVQDCRLRISLNRAAAKHHRQDQDHVCALARNAYAKEAIQRHFRLGLMEMDDMQESDADPEGFLPGASQRNYTEVNLPVFCVSAHEYARIKGMHGSNTEPAIFKNENDTEIPALRQATKDITRFKGTETTRKVLQLLQHFINGVDVYLEADNDERSEEGAKLRDTFNHCVGPLIQSWERVASAKTTRLKRELRSVIGPKLVQGSHAARDAAVLTITTFGGDTRWNTYKATMVRDGEFKTSLNEILAEPITKEAAMCWKQLFDSGINVLFQDLHKSLMHEAKQAFLTLEVKTPPSLRDRLRTLIARQEPMLETSLKLTVEKAVSEIKDIQKGLSRQISPDIQKQLHTAYVGAGRQRGMGCFMRMKDIMLTEVSENANDMFKTAAKQTIDRLDELGNQVQASMAAEFAQLYRTIELNFSGLWEAEVPTAEQMHARELVRERVQRVGTEISRLLERAMRAESDGGTRSG